MESKAWVETYMLQTSEGAGEEGDRFEQKLVRTRHALLLRGFGARNRLHGRPWRATLSASALSSASTLRAGEERRAAPKSTHRCPRHLVWRQPVANGPFFFFSQGN